MECNETTIIGVKMMTPQRFEDERGDFFELYNRQQLSNLEIKDNWVQDNILTSKKGALRGVHTQIKHPQAKLVTCLSGEVFDVVVDCRKDSPTFSRWYGTILSVENNKQLYIPEGVAHGFLSLEDSILNMKVTTHYYPGDELGFLWNDDQININWPIHRIQKVILAEKDKQWLNFHDFIQDLAMKRNSI